MKYIEFETLKKNALQEVTLLVFPLGIFKASGQGGVHSQSVLDQYGFSVKDIINLCGGIPTPDATSIQVTITATYSSALCVKVLTDQYEVIRNMDFQIGRIDNNYMYVEQRGQGIGTKLFLTQVQTARKFQFKRLHTTAMAPEDELDWSGYYFWAEWGYENADTEEYEAWAVEMERDEPTLSELVQSESGRETWRNSGFTWIGNFYLADDHPCMAYLRKHLERKGIDLIP